MRLRGHRHKSLVISILLIMVCVQSFSMHFHFADGDEHHQSHAHAHTHGSMDADHFTTEHEEEVNTDILGILIKPQLSLDLFVFVILALFPIALSKQPSWLGVGKKRPRIHLLFFRPPLRAPPCLSFRSFFTINFLTLSAA